MLGGAFIALLTLLRTENGRRCHLISLCGFIAGQLRTLAPDREDIWSFSPFIDLSVYRMIRRNLPTPRLFDWQVLFFVTIVALRFVQTELSRFLPRATFTLEGLSRESLNPWVWIAIYATSIIAIGTERKIWNSVRIQIKLEEQERLLLHARMAALQKSRINLALFLFQTVLFNSVSSRWCASIPIRRAN